MGLKGNLVSQTKIKSNGNAYYELFVCKPCDIANISPDIVQSCDLQGGQWGANGAVYSWTWKQEGQQLVAKDIIDGVDKAKRSCTYKVIEGALLQDYNSFKFILNVDCNGAESLVTWKLEYEKKAECAPEPHAMMDVLVALTKAIECNHMLMPN